MNIYKLIKWPFFKDFMVDWINPLSETEEREWERVIVKSKSGAFVAGLFAKAINPAKATIILGHPMGKEAKGYFLKRGYPDLLKKNGFNVLVFDLNGFGESSHGNFSYFEDIVAISIKAKELTPKLPIGYHGISLGAQWATIAFADEHHKFDFAIIESAAPTLDDFWIHFPVAHKTLKLLNILMPRFRQKIKMIDRIKHSKNLNSILYIYSISDTWTTPEMGEKYLRNTNVNSELWLVDDAKHAEIMRSDHKQEYQDKIISFFNEQTEKITAEFSLSVE